MTADTIIRPATKDDCALIVQFIKELAIYEKLEHEAKATSNDIETALFASNPKAFCAIAEVGGKPAGFALCFYNFSTFVGKAGIYLEDLFVRPEFRGNGIGKKFFQYLAQRALEENCGRVEFSVLDWNTPSIEFYKALGAKAMDEWTVYRLEGQAIADVAQAQKKAA